MKVISMIHTYKDVHKDPMDPQVCHKECKMWKIHKYTSAHSFYSVKYYKYFTKQNYKLHLRIKIHL